MTRAMKDSEVEWIGEIPEDWEAIRLKDKYKFEKGKNACIYTKEYVGTNVGEYPVYSGQTENKGIMGYINSWEYNLKDSIYTTTVGAKVMTANIISGMLNLSQNCVLFINKDKNINDKFIFYALNPLFKYEKSMIPSYMQPSLRIEDLKRYTLYVPSIIKQKSIANFLDKKTLEIDNIISKTKEVIKEYKKYKQSLITEVVTTGLNKDVELKDSGIEWIGKIPEHWDTVKFKRLFRILNGKEIKNELNKNSENAIKVYGSGGVFKYTDDFLHNKTSILFGRKGTIGKPVIAEGKFWTVDTMYYTDIIHGNLKYIYYMLKAFPWETITTQTALPSITSTDLLNKYMSVAPLKEQEQIANYLDKKCAQIDNIIQTKEKLLVEMECYKKSLIYETVTGKREVN